MCSRTRSSAYQYLKITKISTMGGYKFVCPRSSAYQYLKITKISTMGGYKFVCLTQLCALFVLLNPFLGTLFRNIRVVVNDPLVIHNHMLTHNLQKHNRSIVISSNLCFSELT
jgi:hypothetical protein